ncbi:MAG: diguanylate cyclase [Deltaproteobacteria bacterium]|nr:diguanylate cyclase [Deltaproteobacteria bacterium]
MKLNCRLKLIFSISLLVFACQLTTGYIIIRQSEESLHEKNHNHGKELAQSMAAFSVKALADNDLSSLRGQIEVAMHHDNVRHVVIVDTGHKVLVSDNPSQVDSIYPPETIKKSYFLEKQDTNHHYRDANNEIIAEITAPISAGENSLGSVILGYSQLEIAEKVVTLNRKIGITLLIGFAGAFIITILLTAMITRPLLRLEKTALKIARGNFEIDKPVNRCSDEFNLLSQTMYNMAKRLEELVYNDPLTGLYNRQLLNIRLSEELARSRRHGQPLAMLLVDIDHFKRVNDTYGHLVGDEMLVKVTSLIAKHIREVDCLARFGGEEFIILAPDMTENNARQQLAERIRSAVAKERFISSAGEQDIDLTISVGLAIYPTDAQNERELLVAADQALYGAKFSGRNQVKTFSEMNTPLPGR